MAVLAGMAVWDVAVDLALAVVGEWIWAVGTCGNNQASVFDPTRIRMVVTRSRITYPTTKVVLISNDDDAFPNKHEEEFKGREKG